MTEQEGLIEQVKSEAKALLDKGDVYEALPLLRQAAHWSDPESQKLVYEIYDQGLYGVIPNAQAAFEYARMAAFNEDAKAMALVGKYFLEGKGTDKDEEKAFYYLSKAALLGESSALDPLGTMFLKGQHTDKNPAKALELFEAAAAVYPEDEHIEKHKKLAKLALSRQEDHK